MRIISFLLLAAFSSSAFSATLPAPVLPALPPVSAPVKLPGVPDLDASFPHGLSLVEFARVVLQDVLKEDFIFSTDFLDSKAVVGFSAKSLKKSGSESLLREVLAEHGYSITRFAGYYRVSKTDERKLAVDFWYRPQYRSVAYLSSIVRPLFSDGSFSYERPIQRSGAGSSSAVAPSSPGSRPVDNGASLYSQTTQSDVDAFLFRGSAADVSRLKSVLAQVDVPVPKVLVRALVLEVADSKNEAWGVSAVAKLLSDQLSVSISGNVSQMSGALSFKGPNFEAVAGVFGSSSRVSVLTAPSSVVEAGASSDLSVGSSVPVLGAIQYSENGGSSRQSVEYRDTGVILRVTPRIYDSAVSLDVRQEISDAVSTTTGVAGSPTLLKRAISTSLNVSSGDFVIIGGLSSAKSAAASDYIPFLERLRLALGGSAVQSKTDVVVVLYVERV